MKVLIATDSFKSTLTSLEAATCIETGIHRVFKDAEIIKMAIGDGGEGTQEALLQNRGGQRIVCEVSDPLGKKIQSDYGLIDQETAIVEVAKASGLQLITPPYDVLKTTSLGTGELIVNALNRGVKTIYVAMGGSATNDGGMGLLHALGYSFYDNEHQELMPISGSLSNIHSIERLSIHPALQHAHFHLLSDVQNPLLGRQGATYIFGPQKGVIPDLLAPLDQAMENYAFHLESLEHVKYRDFAGAGAAGGIGFALLCATQANLQSGIATVLEMNDFEATLINCDLVVTGEGQFDQQTLFGKVPVGIAHVAKKYHKPVIVIAGATQAHLSNVIDEGIDVLMSTVTHFTTKEQLLRNAKENLIEASERTFRAVALGMNLKEKQ